MPKNLKHIFSLLNITYIYTIHYSKGIPQIPSLLYVYIYYIDNVFYSILPLIGGDTCVMYSNKIIDYIQWDELQNELQRTRIKNVVYLHHQGMI